MTAVLGLLPASPGGVRLARLPDLPAPVGTEVRVRMVRAPINPADLLLIAGRYTYAPDPTAPIGAEGVGEVEAVGPEVDDLQPGMLVLPLSRGNWCTHRLLPRAELIRVPDRVSPQTAAMLRINPPTAALLLDRAAVRPGSVIAQNAAGSVVAGWVRRLAARRGVIVLDIVRRPLPDLPDALVDGPDLADRVAARLDGRPLVAALDCVAGEASARLASCLAPGGRLIVFGHLSGAPVTIASQLLTSRQLTVCGFSLRPAEQALGAERVRALFGELRAVCSAAPAPLVKAVYPLAEAAAALAAATAGGGRVQFDLTGSVAAY